MCTGYHSSAVPVEVWSARSGTNFWTKFSIPRARHNSGILWGQGNFRIAWIHLHTFLGVDMSQKLSDWKCTCHSGWHPHLPVYRTSFGLWSCSCCVHPDTWRMRWPQKCWTAAVTWCNETPWDWKKFWMAVTWNKNIKFGVMNVISSVRLQ